MTLDLKASCLDITEYICNIESVSGNEKQLADEIEQELSRFAHLRVTRDGNALVARTRTQKEKHILIAGHLDTVVVHKNLPVEHREQNGERVLWGRGTVDMKGGVAVMLKLAAELQNPRHDITWVFYDNEEIEESANGLGRLMRTFPDFFQANMAILCEPTNADVEAGCNGTLRFEVKTSGVRAHSARSWMGKNAIHQMAHVLQLLDQYVAEHVDVGGLVYREGLNAVGISGGVAGNVIPDECSMLINYRFAPSRSVQEALEVVQTVFEGYEIKVLDQAAGAFPGMETEAIQDFLDAVSLPVSPKYGWTDVSRLSALGIPALNFGPGDPHLAHADDEQVEYSSIEKVERTLREWLQA